MDIPWWGYALGTMLMFGVTNFLLKVAAKNSMDSVFASQILWLSVGLFGVLFFIYYNSTGAFQANLSKTPTILLALPIIAGVTLACGMYCIKRAVSLGPAGPATAISAGNAALVALLAYIFLKDSVSFSKLAGRVLVLAGIIVMSVFE